MSKGWKIALILVALVSFAVALSYPIRYSREQKENEEGMARLAAIRQAGLQREEATQSVPEGMMFGSEGALMDGGFHDDEETVNMIDSAPDKTAPEEITGADHDTAKETIGMTGDVPEGTTGATGTAPEEMTGTDHDTPKETTSATSGVSKETVSATGNAPEEMTGADHDIPKETTGVTGGVSKETVSAAGHVPEPTVKAETTLNPASTPSQAIAPTSFLPPTIAPSPTSPLSPTIAPSPISSFSRTIAPTQLPSSLQTIAPTQLPSSLRTIAPSPTPSPSPTVAPTPTPDRRLRTGKAQPYPEKEKAVFDEADILPEFRELYEINPDLVGWITIPDTVIDYPVVQSDDSEFYLEHDFYGEKNSNGQIILDAKCDPYTPSYNLVVSGHNMKSGSMFGSLANYMYESYWKKHRTLEMDVLTERRDYVVFAAFFSADYDVDEEGFRYNADIQYRLDMETWLEEIRANQLYETDVDVEFGDEFLTLTTCNHSRRQDGRFVLVCRRIREGEEIE